MKKKTTNNKTINITQVKSTIGRNKIQKKNLISLGLKKIDCSKSIIINKSTKGLIKKINHISLKNVAAGYDIESFEIPKKKKIVKRYIEVKAVPSENFHFFWSRQEMEHSKLYKNNYYLYLLPVVGKNTFDIEKLEIIRNPSIKILKGDKWLSEIEKMSFAKKELVQK